MKIALIGNMNNNGFSLLRYFLDLGVEAALFPYSDDGVGNLTHFCPEADTWQFEKWRNHVSVLPFANNIKSLWTLNLTSKNKKIREIIDKLMSEFDFIIGSGIAPALFEKHGGRLNAFYPYSLGVEFLGAPSIVKIANNISIRSLLYRYSMNLQKKGIQHSHYCFNAEMGLTKDTLDSINRDFDRLAVPMVFNRELFPPKECVPLKIMKIIDKIQQYKFVVFSHSRLYWIRDALLSEADFMRLSKNSDWLLRGFSKFVSQCREDVVLILVEYGPDVEATKELAVELGISEYIIWLPKMKRREIMYIMQYIDVGVGEFYSTPGTIWGGTGWEVLASGKPLLQAFNFSIEGYTEQFGHPPPTVLHADSPETVAQQLRRMFSMPADREQIGIANAKWFDKNNGIGLAREWLTRMGVLADLRSNL
jgi:hypothetical protein